MLKYTGYTTLCPDPLLHCLLLLPVLARTYARSVPGTLLTTSFNDTSGLAVITFTPMLTGGTAKLFLSKRLHYARGYTLAFSPAHCCKEVSATLGTASEGEVWVQVQQAVASNVVVTISSSRHRA